MKKNIGIIFTWPWGLEIPEGEVLRRLQVAATNIGVNLVSITKEGYLVDENLYKTDRRVDPQTLEFVISMHYEDVKLLDAFHYHTAWIPPDIMLQNAQCSLLAQNMASNDDFLIYDDGGMRDFIQAFVYKPLDLKNASSLTASFPKTMMLPPALPEKPSLFYCGLNWERIFKKEARLKGLFELLDKQPYTRLYGPQQAWKGYRSYKGKIPFDGKSILKDIAQSGVVLALSGPFHYRAGAATNRIYEACAGGAVTISDTNRFIQEHWGDSVLYIDHDPAHPERMFEQIDAHMKWIVSHPQEALAMAQRAQKICLEKFALEKQLTDIFNNHTARQAAVSNAFYAQNHDENVLAVLFLDSLAYGPKETEILQRAVENIQRQLYRKITLAVCCEEMISGEVKKAIEKYPFVRIFAFKFYDKCTNKILSRAQAFFKINKQIAHDYVLFMEGEAAHFSTHITQLKRALEDNPSANAAGCATYQNTPEIVHTPGWQKAPGNGDIYKGICPDHRVTPADMFLMRAGAENLPECTHRYIDNMLPNALLMEGILNQHRSLVFVPKISCGQTRTGQSSVFPTISPDSCQLRFMAQWVKLTSPDIVEQLLTAETAGALPVAANRYLVRAIKGMLRMQILLHSARLLWTFDKDTRKRVQTRIKDWKAKRKKLDETLY